MFDELTAHTALTLRMLTGLLRRDRQATGDEGATTLELVVLALGLLTVAGLLVAALTVAVNGRIGHIR